MGAKLDAIFFDIDDTLFSTSVFADKARRAAVDAMLAVGLRADRSACYRELQEVVAEFSSNYGTHFDKLLDRLPPEAVDGLNRSVIIAAGVVAYHETKWSELQVFDDVYEVLGWMSGLDAVLGVISAGWSIKQAEKIIRLKIYEFLDPRAIYITDQVGINKPNPKLYQKVLRELELEPGRCMYVGDNPTHDIDPCNEVGLVTVQLRRTGRYSDARGATAPDHEIRDFYGLREILRRDYGFAT